MIIIEKKDGKPIRGLNPDEHFTSIVINDEVVIYYQGDEPKQD